MVEPRWAVSLHGLHAWYGGDIRPVIDVAVAADELGIDTLTLPDHVVMGTAVDAYPYGDFPLPDDFAWFEPLTLLAAIAARTSKIRLSTSVLIAPLRPAGLLAKIIATLDQVAGGRVELGVGTGWQREEYVACGVPFERRSARLMEELRACRALWSGQRVTERWSTVELPAVRSLPTPVQREELPLWLGMAPTPRSCQWFAELEAGWIPMAVRPDALATGIAAIRDAYEAAGRDAAALRVRAGLPLCLDGSKRPDLRATLDGVEPASAVGVTDFEIFASAFVRRAADIEKVLQQIADYGR